MVAPVRNPSPGEVEEEIQDHSWVSLRLVWDTQEPVSKTKRTKGAGGNMVIVTVYLNSISWSFSAMVLELSFASLMSHREWQHQNAEYRVTNLWPCAVSAMSWSYFISELQNSLVHTLQFTTFEDILPLYLILSFLEHLLCTRNLISLKEIKKKTTVGDGQLHVFINVEGITQMFLPRKVKVIDDPNCLYLLSKYLFIFINIYLIIYLCLYVSVWESVCVYIQGRKMAFRVLHHSLPISEARSLPEYGSSQLGWKPSSRSSCFWSLGAGVTGVCQIPGLLHERWDLKFTSRD